MLAGLVLYPLHSYDAGDLLELEQGLLTREAWVSPGPWMVAFRNGLAARRRINRQNACNFSEPKVLQNLRAAFYHRQRFAKLTSAQVQLLLRNRSEHSAAPAPQFAGLGGLGGKNILLTIAGAPGWQEEEAGDDVHAWGPGTAGCL